MIRNQLGVGILLLAYVLLLPGLTQPILTITATAEKAELIAMGKRMVEENPDSSILVTSIANMVLNQMDAAGSVVAYEKSRSILGTVRDLFQKHHYLVGFLIIFFSVIVPLIKGFMMLITHMKISPSLAIKMKKYSGLISKWSMADVFVIGLFVAFLAANAVRKEADLLSFEATLGAGFYFFLAYCLLTILSSQLLESARTKTASD